MIRKALIVVLLSGCSSPSEAPPANPGLSPTEKDLKQVRETLSVARTVRIRLQGEWPHAIGRMPRSVAGTVLLGEAGRAKISLKSTYAGGGFETYEAISDGTTLWRSPRVEAANFRPASGGLRDELLMALAWYGLGWSFPQGPHPKTLGEGYVICDLLPQERDLRPSFLDRAEPGLRTINHQSPGVQYRVRLSFDPATHQIRKRELIGDRDVVWYIETYPEVILNAAIPDDESLVPGK